MEENINTTELEDTFVEGEVRRIKPENVYATRGCCGKIKLDDNSREHQMASCGKMHAYGWTQKLEIPNPERQFNIVEVRFKNSRKDFFRFNPTCEQRYQIGDIVTVDGVSGYDVGIITLVGDIVKLQLKKRNIAPDSDTIKKLHRLANANDIEKWNSTIETENQTQERSRKIAMDLGLAMKINSVEYQGDFTKATFYYTADDRVDFRQLIRVLAETFRVKIEMKQIGLRQEAQLLGGVGSCGRELCCATWKNQFQSVGTQAARVQQLSPNPQKLAGQCSKIKCCLNYEYETYQEALKNFPNEQPIETIKGRAHCVKIDVFKELMYYAYDATPNNFMTFSVQTIKDLLEKVKLGEKIEMLEEYTIEAQKHVAPEAKVDFENVVGQDDLTRFDTPKSNNKKHKGNRPGGNRNNQQRSEPRSGKQKPETRNQKPEISANAPQQKSGDGNQQHRHKHKPHHKPNPKNQQKPQNPQNQQKNEN